MTWLGSMRNLVSGLLLALLGAAVFWATAGFATGVAAAADPALLPRVVGAGLILVGLAVAAGDVVRRVRGVQVEEDAEGVPLDLPVEMSEEMRAEQELDEQTAGPPDWRQVASLIGAIVVYCLGAFRIGFLTFTTVFIVGVSLLLGRGRGWRSIALLVLFAVCVAGGFHIAFFELLSVRQPITPLP